jgi:hypothetical protein
VHPTPLERNTKVTALQIDSLKAKEVTRFMQSFETASVK